MLSLTNRVRFNKCGAVRCGLAAALLVFIVYSAPHRVHHAFEEGPLGPVPRSQSAPRSDRHGDEHDHEPKSSQQSDCAARLAAQNTHFASAPLTAVPLSAIAYVRSELVPTRRTASFNPSPFSQRAPPLS
jgi:hypothetical protein